MGDTGVTEKRTRMSPSRVTPVSPYLHPICRHATPQATTPHHVEQLLVFELSQCPQHRSTVNTDTPSQVRDSRSGEPIGLCVAPQCQPHKSSGTRQRGHSAVDKAVEHRKPTSVPTRAPL